MLKKANLYLTWKKNLFSLCLFFFFVFISLGNLPRILKTSLFSDHLLLSEVFLYLFSFLSLLFIKISKKAVLHLCFWSFLTFLSFIYGSFLQGYDLHAMLYTIRLIFFFITSYVLSAICFERFKGSILSFFSFLSKAYLIALFIGFVFYFVFPKASELWALLNSYQVTFHGDPHVKRFVSVYFDPNYYACIACIPFLLSCFLYEQTKKRIYLLQTFLFALSGLFTWSRSGIFLLGSLLLWMLFSFRKKLLSRKKIYPLLGICLILCCSIFLFWEELSLFFHRTFHVLEDDSALYRFHTFKMGLSLLKEHPLFGIGYHFLYQYTHPETGLHSLDSSLLSLLVQIGALPFLGLFAYFLYKLCFLPKIFHLWKEQQKDSSLFLGWFSFYGFFTFFFASQFNNVLFYLFWALPFTVITLFILKSLKKETATLKKSG